MKTNHIKKDFYKIAACIKSSETDKHFNTCKRLIELFENKHNGNPELTFAWVNKHNYLLKLSRELEKFINQQKARNMLYNINKT